MDLRVTDTAADGVHLISDGQTVMATVHRGGRELADTMAAAPDLLKALEETRNRLSDILAQFDHVGCTCTFPSDDCCAYAAAETTLEKANAAIAKAKGSAQ